jgi:hypothetical protein
LEEEKNLCKDVKFSTGCSIEKDIERGAINVLKNKEGLVESTGWSLSDTSGLNSKLEEERKMEEDDISDSCSMNSE